jgi:hypothetical protein
MRRLLLILLIIAPILGYAAGMGPGPGVKSYSAGDTTPPTKSSLTIPSAGTTLLLGLSETCSIGAGGNGGLTLSMSGGAVTASYSSGSGSNTFTYNLSRTVNSGETGTASYTQPGNGIEDAAGNDLASFSSQAVTNNSTQSEPHDTLGPISIASNGDDGQISYEGSPSPTWQFFTGGSDSDGIGAVGATSGNNPCYGFFRFQVPSTIPTGATFTSSTVLELYCIGIDGWVNGSDDLTIVATKGDNADAPSTATTRPSASGGNITVTTSSVAWNNITWSTTAYNTSPSIASIIQELHDAYGLAAGDYVTIWVYGSVNGHVAGIHLYEIGSYPARLTIVY